MTPDDLHAALAAMTPEETAHKLFMTLITSCMSVQEGYQDAAEADIATALSEAEARGRAKAFEEGIARLRALKAGMKEFNEGCPVEWDPGELDVVDLCTAALRALKNAPTQKESKDET